jgi:hypothetical protein
MRKTISPFRIINPVVSIYFVLGEEMKRMTMTQKVKAGPVTLALGLVAIGLGMLVYNFGGFLSPQSLWKFWPLLLICLGLEYFIRKIRNKDSEVVFHVPSTLLIGAVIVTGVFINAISSANMNSVLDDIFFKERVSFTRQWQAEPFTPAEGTRVAIENENGTLRIGKSEDSNIHVTAEIMSFGPTEEKARLEAESKEVYIEKGPVTRIVAGYGSMSRNFSRAVNLRVDLPLGLIISVDVSDGEVEVDNAEGQFTIRTENGAVTARDLDGSLEVSSENGRITAEGISGNISAVTENGKINIKNPAADVAAVSQNGAVELASDIPLDKNYLLQNEEGALRLRLPVTSNLEIEARTNNGSITGLGSDKSSDPALRGSDRLKLGTGKGSARLITDNGSIVVNAY